MTPPTPVERTASRRRRLSGWGLLVAVGCTRAPEPPGLSLPEAPAGQVVFASDRAGAMAVFAVDRAGAFPKRLSPSDGAAWFPGPATGAKLAMVRASDTPGSPHLEQLYWRTRSDGPTAVGAPAAAVRNPDWARDGELLLYESSEAGFRDIWSVRPGQPPVQRTASPAGCFEPQALPDGAMMVVVCSGRDPDLRKVALEGVLPDPSPPALMERVGEDLRPTPGGRGGRVAFLAELDGGLTVWTVQPDGQGAGPAWSPPSGQALVPEQPPRWSPDGTQLAVVLRRSSGAPMVWLLSFGTSEPPVATGHPLAGLPASASVETPVWIADGTLLVTVDDGGAADIWRIDPRTGASEVWVHSEANDWLPRWWPDAAPTLP